MGYKLLLLLCCLSSTVSFSQENDNLKDVLDAVSPDAVKATMSFLADDLLEGRQPGTKGYGVASAYIQTKFI